MQSTDGNLVSSDQRTDAGTAAQALRPYVAFHASLRGAYQSFVGQLEDQCRSLVQHHLEAATSSFAVSLLGGMPLPIPLVLPQSIPCAMSSEMHHATFCIGRERQWHRGMQASLMTVLLDVALEWEPAASSSSEAVGCI